MFITNFTLLHLDVNEVHKDIFWTISSGILPCQYMIETPTSPKVPDLYDYGSSWEEDVYLAAA